jgi:predicted dithiol-disulfide oxidoreductase (DUF899 family)
MKPRPYPNETASYRKARNELLDAEQALRAKLEQVAELRRGLPLGGEVPEDYVFETRAADGRDQSVRLSELFADGHDSLLVYGFMFGPAMDHACPLCTSFLDSLDGAIPHLQQRMSVAVSARSPIERISSFAAGRGWRRLRLISSANNSYQRDYLAEGEDGGQWPMANVFVRRDGAIRHFWGSELFFRPFEGGNTRHIDLLWPLWNVLDLTPQGRGETWYPSLSYGPLK